MPSSSAFCATPTARDAVWMRALSNVAMSCLNPCPSRPPSRFSAGTDERGADLGAGAERGAGDIGARQLLRDDAHGELAETEAAGALGHGEAEHAERRHLLDHGERDQLVLEMPVMSEGRDALRAEAPELVAHHVERLLAKRDMAEIAAVERILQQLGEPGARRLAVAGAR